MHPGCLGQPFPLARSEHPPHSMWVHLPRWPPVIAAGCVGTADSARGGASTPLMAGEKLVTHFDQLNR